MWCTQPGEAIIALAPELALDCTTELTGDMLTLMYLYNNGVMCRKGEILATPVNFVGLHTCWLQVNKPMHIPVISFPHTCTDAATTYFSIYFDMDIGHSKMGT